MSKSIVFKTENQSADTPFNPLNEWDRITGAALAEARTWRTICVLSMAAFFISLGVLVWAFSLPKKIPVIVSLSEIGEAKYIGDASKFSYTGITVPEVAIHFSLRSFVSNMYTVPGDSEVLKKNLQDCYSYLTSNSASKLTNVLKKSNPFDNFGSVRKKVLIETVLAITKDSYQVDFILETSRPDGTQATQKKIRGLLTIKMLEPSESDRLTNPLGIYIMDFDFTEIGVK